MFDGLRGLCRHVGERLRAPGPPGSAEQGQRAAGAKPRAHRPNLFEAAAVHIAACADADDQRSAEAAEWVSPEALAFGVHELACRAVIALARERDESPQEVARSLLGLPVA
ncbi:hypothetical protein ACQUSR_32150 [Streptomyces sp. P1-3]|uniref:hypothetical protein n=1 Tax=Streptomyces sp. P1-3 TaxID=3421658 RepID=UPI003D361A57